MANWKKIIVSGSISELFHISASGNIVPVTDDASSLGSANQQFKDLFIDGTANIDSLVADTANIDAGTIDGVTLGTNSAVTEAQIDNVNIDGNTINASSGDLTITAAGGDISFGNENLSNTGTISTTGVFSTTALITGSKDLFIGKKGTSSVSASNGTIELTGNITVQYPRLVRLVEYRLVMLIIHSVGIFSLLLVI